MRMKGFGGLRAEGSGRGLLRTAGHDRNGACVYIYIYIYATPPPLKPTFYRKTMACALENPFQAAFPGKYKFHNKYVTNTRDIPLL